MDIGSATLAAALARVAEGDRAAFEEVYRLTSARLFGACLHLIGDRAEAEEVLQDSYLAIWRSAGTFDPARGRPMTWLLTLVRNRAVDRLREGGRADRRAQSVEASADPVPTPFMLAAADEETRELARCLDQLASDDLHFIRTAFFEGSTYADLARRAALPLGTVKSRIRRALLSLRRCLA